MNTFRSESLRYCLGFTFLISVGIFFAGVWSLKAGATSEMVLISSLDPSLWLAGGINLVGASLGWYLRDRLPVAASWAVCLSAGAVIFVLVSTFFDPHYLFGFIIPLLFAIFLLEWKHSAAFMGLVLIACILLAYFHFQNWAFSNLIAFPIFLLVAVYALIEVIFNEIHSNLNWFYKKYQAALRNEQIIRDNEIKLEKLVNSLNDYKKYLSETNMSLIVARNEAEQARNVKQIFVQNVSHELRTPLNLIIGFSETMVNSPQSYGEVNWTPDLRGDVKCIFQNSQHLKALIDDILDMASLENKKYEIEVSTVDLNSLVDEIVLITESAYKSKGLFLTTDLPRNLKKVRADSIRVKQVLLNLLSNALKYTKTGGVNISSSSSGSMATVIVRDTGIGIPEEDLDKVFEAFFQVDKSSSREDFGTGLGLAISKQLIELHGGQMSITSKLGKGTSVFFSLPLAQD
jgi:signal transduction histidine kinase